MCCISTKDHRKLFAQFCAGILRQPDQSLHGPDLRKRLAIFGSFPAMLEYKRRRVSMTLYVQANVATPLLSQLAGTQLGMVARLDTVSDAKQTIID